eukprot:1157087-Pelagomonas_calceolata.AAC.3
MGIESGMRNFKGMAGLYHGDRVRHEEFQGDGRWAAASVCMCVCARVCARAHVRVCYPGGQKEGKGKLA